MSSRRTLSERAATPVVVPVKPQASFVALRAERQRERILDAAELCFIQSGFHAASMVHIAQTADMSAGLIYRYFDSKSAIVKAIIERHLESDQHKLIGRLNTAEDVSRIILQIFDSWRRRNDPKMNPVLMIELAAESTRDPEIAHAVRSKDQAIELSAWRTPCAAARAVARRQAHGGSGPQPRGHAAVPGRGPGPAGSARSEAATRHHTAGAGCHHRRVDELTVSAMATGDCPGADRVARRARPARSALAAGPQPLSRLGVGNHAAADAGDHRHRLLRAVSAALP